MTEEHTEKQTCQECGEALEPGASFCWNCENLHAHEQLSRSAAEENLYTKQVEVFWRHAQITERQLEEWDDITKLASENQQRISKLLDRWETFSDRLDNLLSRFNQD